MKILRWFQIASLVDVGRVTGMKQILLMIAVVMGQSVLAADKKPLTKEESAKVIEATIRFVLKKPTGELTKPDLEKLKWLKFDSKQLTDVTGLEKLPKLRTLYLDGNHLTELPKGLEKLTQVRKLDFRDNNLTDVKGLEKLTQLEVLWLSDNKLIDVKGLEKLTKLWLVILSDNNLTDVKGLEKLTNLKLLTLDNNPALTKAQIAELRKALPKCEIYSNPAK